MTRTRRTVGAGAAAAITVGILAAAAPPASVSATEPTVGQPYFRRVSTVYADENPGGIAAEIVAAADGGNTLLATDSPAGQLGFFDITDPANPIATGAIDMGGEPTSVKVKGQYALVGVNTSPSFTAPSGKLVVIDVGTKAVVTEIDMGGQPDSVDIAKTGRYAVVAVENERDEGVAGGDIPQLPAGHVVIVDLVGAPAAWTTRTVALTGLAEVAPEDPEPEFVDINLKGNRAVVSLQENNHLVVIDLPTATVRSHFSAGTTTVAGVDTVDDNIISLTGSITEPREPDTVQWISNDTFAAANEGDYEGGSRSFTVYNTAGTVLHENGNAFEYLAVRNGHFPEDRADAKGVEPEGMEYSKFKSFPFLFVGAERAGYIGVYRAGGTGASPSLVQILPTGMRPEGILAIPERGLLVSSNEGVPADGLPSTITIFTSGHRRPSYPTLTANDATPGVPIGWGAQSGLAADGTTLYSVSDSVYNQSRVFTIDPTVTPARITASMPVTVGGVPQKYDLEGIATRTDGGFWLASEGAATSANPNRLLRIDSAGEVQQEVLLPATVADDQVQYGFEGVSSVGSGAAEQVYVAFQREWKADAAGLVRIGRYTPSTDSWAFYSYPLDAVESPNGGWVGLSELTHLGGSEFAVIERDNQAGRNARIKRLYTFDLAGLTPEPEGSPTPFPTVTKTLARDLMGDLEAGGGLVLEKVEGMTVSGGTTFVVTDNDGVDKTTGETQFLRLPAL